MIDYRWLLCLRDVCKTKTDDFAGLGLIFAKNLDGLPCLPLIENKTLDFISLNVDIIETLKLVSSYKSPYHDGFHIINPKTNTLTGLCYYISPPIPKGFKIHTLNRIGARLMTALLTSKLPSVSYTVAISSQFDLTICRQGIISRISQENAA